MEREGAFCGADKGTGVGTKGEEGPQRPLLPLVQRWTQMLGGYAGLGTGKEGWQERLLGFENLSEPRKREGPEAWAGQWTLSSEGCVAARAPPWLPVPVL